MRGLVFFSSSILICISEKRNLLAPRAHVRLLIQSVSNSPIPAPFSDSCSPKSPTSNKNQFFCTAASTLDSSQGSPNGLFSQSDKITKKQTNDARINLQDLGDAYRNDDIREATHMKEAWDNTIIQELKLIANAISDELAFHKQSGESAETILKQKDSDEVKTYFFDPIFKFEKGKRTLAEKVSQDVLVGRRSHSDENWQEIVKHHASSAEALEEVRAKLDQIMSKMNDLFDMHLKMIETEKENVRFRPDGPASVQSGTGESSTFLNEPYTIAEVSKANDAFNEEEAGKLGAYIVDLIAARGSASDNKPGLGEFLNLQGGSPAETMDRLTTLLNFLYIRKMAQIDAKKNLIKLLKEIAVLMDLNKKDESANTGGAHNGGLEASLAGLVTQLSNLEEYAKVVYADVARYPPVTIDGKEYQVVTEDDENVDHFEQYKKDVEDSKAKDAFAEMHPRVKLLVNVARRMHSHMLGFVADTRSKEWLGTTEIAVASSEQLTAGNLQTLKESLT